ncbi:MAG: response regulator [Nitrospirae bacterium]|nr:response regulator [Nitrospirota bacterium]
MPTILIVDDEQYMRRLMEQTLEPLENDGVDILTARSGEEALETIKAKKPELVLLDIMMPNMDGYELCKIVKHDLGMNEVSIIMVTAKGQDVDKEDGIQSGCDDYITKPFGTKELRSKAREILFPTKK